MTIICLNFNVIVIHFHYLDRHFSVLYCTDKFDVNKDVLSVMTPKHDSDDVVGDRYDANYVRSKVGY